VNQVWKLNLKEMTGEDISDGYAECLFCTGLFTHDKHGEKWAQCVRCYRWAHEDCGGSGRPLCVPHVQKRCKIVRYIMKHLLSHIKTLFVY
jgi:hypothetical protein